MDLVKKMIDENDIKNIEELLFKKLNMSEAMFCIPPLPSNNEEIVNKYAEETLNRMEEEIKEWFDLTCSGCYHRTLIRHPITKLYYLEFITKRTINNKKRYIIKIEDDLDINHNERASLSNLDMKKAVLLKKGMLQKILIYLTAKGVIYETIHQTEALNI
jgi:hypothetical protein